MILGIVLIVVAVLLVYFEFLAVLKRKKLEDLREHVTNKNGKKSILDYYLRSSNHKSILEEIPNRISNIDLGQGAVIVKSLIKQFVNFDKEKKASLHEEVMLLMLNEGLDVKVHKAIKLADDFVIILNGNDYKPARVIYGNYHDVMGELESGRSNNIIVSSDVYEVLEGEGSLLSYQNKGYAITDGLFRENDIKIIEKKINKNIENISEISEDSIEFGEEFFNISMKNQFKKIKDLNYRIKTTTKVFTTGVTLMSVVVFSTGMVRPLYIRFGTLGGIVGGFAGLVLGYLLAEILLSVFRNKKIYKALDFFGRRHFRNFTDDVIDHIGEDLFNYSKVNEYSKSEKELYNMYKGQMNPYMFTKPTIAGMLSKEAMLTSRNFENQIRQAVTSLHEELMTICGDISKKQYKYNLLAQGELKRRLFADIILNNKWLLNDSMYNKHDLKLIKEFEEAKKSMKRYPFTLSIDTETLVKSILFNTFRDNEKTVEVKELTLGKFIYPVSALLASAGVYLMF